MTDDPRGQEGTTENDENGRRRSPLGKEGHPQEEEMGQSMEETENPWGRKKKTAPTSGKRLK